MLAWLAEIVLGEAAREALEPALAPVQHTLKRRLTTGALVLVWVFSIVLLALGCYVGANSDAPAAKQFAVAAILVAPSVALPSTLVWRDRRRECLPVHERVSVRSSAVGRLSWPVRIAALLIGLASLAPVLLLVVVDWREWWRQWRMLGACLPIASLMLYVAIVGRGPLWLVGWRQQRSRPAP